LVFDNCRQSPDAVAGRGGVPTLFTVLWWSSSSWTRGPAKSV
jgi:hypothetical protein